jgi:hypothetical protein
MAMRLLTVRREKEERQSSTAEVDSGSGRKDPSS